MASQTHIVAESVQELISVLAANAEPFNSRGFEKLPGGAWVKKHPWKSTKEVSLRAIGNSALGYVNHDGAIGFLDRFEQEKLHEALSQRFGVELVHGTFRQAVQVSKVRRFRLDVLSHYKIFTSEMVTPQGAGIVSGMEWNGGQAAPYQIRSGSRRLVPDDKPRMELIGDIQPDVEGQKAIFQISKAFFQMAVK